MNDYREQAETIRQAVLWLEEQGGDSTVMRAFGDPKPLDAIWQLELPEFREALRRLVRVALAADRGAA
jgi:hypothetical protein